MAAPQDYTLVLTIIGGFLGIIVTIITIVVKVSNLIEKQARAKKEEEKPLADLKAVLEEHVNAHKQAEEVAPIQKKLDEERLDNRFKDIKDSNSRLAKSVKAMREENANIQANMYSTTGATRRTSSGKHLRKKSPTESDDGESNE